jgi:hypothetical protein
MTLIFKLKGVVANLEQSVYNLSIVRELTYSFVDIVLNFGASVKELIVTKDLSLIN